MADLLDLRNTETTGFRVDRDDHGREYAVVTVRYGGPEPGKLGIAGVQRHGFRRRRVADTPLHGRPAVLEVDIPRFKNVETGRVSTPDVHWVHPRFRMTRRLREHICQRAARDSFDDIAADVGLGATTVSKVVKEHAREAEQLFTPTAPRFLGIDEAHIAGRKRVVLTDVDQRHVVDVLEKQKESGVREAISALADRDRIEAATIDMYPPYRRAIEAALPGVPVVIDKRHVTELARQAMVAERRRVRKRLSKRRRSRLKDDAELLGKRWQELKTGEREGEPDERAILEAWFRRYPKLGQAYWLKERFYRVYQHADRADAEAAFDAWKASIPETGFQEFHQAAATVERWRPYIFAYFDVPITNGYTESANRLLKDRYRRSRGYGGDFSIFRGLILAQHGTRTYRRHVGERRWHLLANKGVCPLGHFDEPAWFEAAERLLTAVFEEGGDEDVPEDTADAA